MMPLSGVRISWLMLAKKSPLALEASLARAVAASMGSFRADSLFSHFRASNVPCLLVYGQNDPSIRVPSVDSTQPLGFNIHQINLDASGHFPMLDEAGKFNRLLTDFLALESGLSPRELQLKEEWRRRVR